MKIKVMPKHMAELIAAGEVVERPASVIKELAENSIDAGASSLTIEIKGGGCAYMRVSDNGAGIAKEDLPLAFQTHATSKVKTEEDLERIATLGFRGEALASICAVSRVEVLTLAAGESIGSSYRIAGGEQEAFEDAGCPKGTTMIVRDLFYNTPARMKFLKKDTTEGNYVGAVVDRIALSHPEVAVRFIREGKQVYATNGDGKLYNAIYAVFGGSFAKSLLAVDYALGGVKVTGFISQPLHCRANRSMQYFFISGRQVKSLTAMTALESAYKNAIMVGKVPACVLHIDLPAEAVDVNVHPAKTEVRFANEKAVFDAVYYACKNALIDLDTPQEMSFEKKDKAFFGKKEPVPVQEQLEIARKKAAPRSDFWTTVDADAFRTAQAPKEAATATAAASPQAPYATGRKADINISFDEEETEAAQETQSVRVPSAPLKEEAESTAQEPKTESETLPTAEPVTVIGELFKTYIIFHCRFTQNLDNTPRTKECSLKNLKKRRTTRRNS